MSDSTNKVSTANTDIKKTSSSAVKPVEAVKKAAASVKASVAPKAESAAATVKEEVEKPVKEVKKAASAAKTTVTKKKTAARKTTARKAATKRTAAPKMESEVFIQFNDLNISSDGLIKRVKEIWAEKGNKESDLKDIKVYVNVAESKAYYVVNKDIFGEFDL